MLKNIAQQTFESYQKIRQLVLDTENGYLFTETEVDEKLGYMMDAVIYRIMHCLEIDSDKDEEIDAYGIIDGCIKDGDSFEYMMKMLGLNDKQVPKINYFIIDKFDTPETNPLAYDFLKGLQGYIKTTGVDEMKFKIGE